MTDYAEERSSELEVLESIFPDELTIISEDQLSIRVEPEVPNPNDPYVLSLNITYSPTYPDELPEIGLECLEGDLDEEEQEQLVMGLIGAANDSLGMAMVYTLSLYLRDSLAELLRERKERVAKAEAIKYQEEEEALARKTAGTKVTPESFAKWKVKFEAEMQALRIKEEEERLKALPPKERDDAKKFFSKATGRQLFETGKATESSLDEEGAVDLDASQYEREDPVSDDEEMVAGLKLGDLSDDD